MIDNRTAGRSEIRCFLSSVNKNFREQIRSLRKDEAPERKPRAPEATSVHGALLDGLLGGERKPGLDGAVLDDPRCDVFSERRTVLEAVA